jgi:hypothetical protein
MSNRSAQLQKLVAHLAALNDVLALDQRCQWRHHFASCLREARSLSDQISQQKLNELSGSVMSVYGGMGSFNDYVPVIDSGGSFIPIPGMDSLNEASELVYESALALRAGEA